MPPCSNCLTTTWLLKLQTWSILVYSLARREQVTYITQSSYFRRSGDEAHLFHLPPIRVAPQGLLGREQPVVQKVVVVSLQGTGGSPHCLPGRRRTGVLEPWLLLVQRSP